MTVHLHCDWAQERKVRWVKMLYDVGNGIWSGQGLNAVGSRVGKLAAGSLCVEERLIVGLPSALCGAVCGGECVVRVGRKGLKGLLRAFGEMSHRGAGKIGGSRVVL